MKRGWEFREVEFSSTAIQTRPSIIVTESWQKSGGARARNVVHFRENLRRFRFDYSSRELTRVHDCDKELAANANTFFVAHELTLTAKFNSPLLLPWNIILTDCHLILLILGKGADHSVKYVEKRCQTFFLTCIYSSVIRNASQCVTLIFNI